ncbi:HAMP domain-containing histidine kinase [Phytoactinopolyspora alkaliphila]|uniref:histidine kinase n=1 Tax=Phytoactinopolyspora alkaliphila TaxID=1783498 RepID=A0A6N9YLM4_9ACTN|nr:HAMP domain-containing histidine kinase [Phytoactinopolyspora alkaliphila]
MNADMWFMLSATAVSCVGVGALGLLALRALRRHSIVLSLVVCALIPVIAVIVAVQVNVRAMFISDHDADVIAIVSTTAGVLAVLIGVVMGRRLAAGSRMVGRGLSRLTEVYENADGDGGPARRRRSPGGRPVSAEIAQLTTQLDDVRRRLEESRNRERALETGRRQLLVAMSHDLRTPLAGLRALAEGLEDGLLDDPDAAYAQIRTTVERMTAMVDDLFELSRLQGMPSQRARARVSVREIIEDVTAEALAAARARGVRLDVDAGGRLPMRGDGDALARALSNLVANAVRYTPSGGSVRVTGTARNGEVSVEVADDCGGIPEEHMPRVFDTGWRGEPQRSPGEHAGLGLAIVRGVADSHGGTVSVRNTGRGCAFELVLPAG